MENGFTTRPVMFEGAPGFITSGYMVTQYHDGKMVAEQFVSEVAYKDFCVAIGIVPVMIV